MSAYPYLEYPHVYILEGGYKGFHEKFQSRCNPDGYIEMNDPAHVEQLRQFSKREGFKRCYSTGFLRT
ncbi:cell division cycle- protein [Podochytrium sp. JEL0797]|nr:cell division cycle- protein [Podochytrium sp. JEL0797]